MARVAVVVAVIFSLFIVSHARFPFDSPANHIQPLTTTSSGTDVAPDLTIRLPSDKLLGAENSIEIELLQESDPSVSVVGPPKVANDRSNPSVSVVGPPKIANDKSDQSVSELHHTRANHLLWYRFRHHCRHHSHPNVEPMVEKNLNERQEISYGNDMMMMGAKTTSDLIAHDNVGQTPTKWGHHHHRHHHHGEEEGGFVKRTVTAVAPLERVKLLLQVQNAQDVKFKGTIQGLKYIWRNEGFRGLLKGNGVCCMRLASYSAIKVCSYDHVFRGISWLFQHQSGKEDAKLTPLLHFGALECTSLIAMSATYPMDMVRGRLTVQIGKSPHQYRGMFHALWMVAREEGARALYKGFLPSVTGVVVRMGAKFIIYECLKDRLVTPTLIGLLAHKEFRSMEGKPSPKQLELLRTVQTRLEFLSYVSGIVALHVSYPFQVIHRRMQMVGWNHPSPIVTGDEPVKAVFEYTGMVDAFKKTVRNEGFGALYKGFATHLLKVGPGCMLAVVMLHSLKDGLGVDVTFKGNRSLGP